MMHGNGQLSVPPGFRFHPTDEELLYYYLRKKVSYEAIDLDVIREVDLNKLEPWDLKDKCRIGSGPQNEWYFFSHKDKKYPTGTRTNRATTAGFWKATGRDKAIHHTNSKRIGMRKTLVFYTGRAPHGQKTDWIMHEYRLDDHPNSAGSHDHLQEDGWVVCRVFKKKNHSRGFQADVGDEDQEQQLFNHEDHHHHHHMKGSTTGHGSTPLLQALDHSKHFHHQPLYHHHHHQYDYNATPFDHSSMHLPQLFSPESAAAAAAAAQVPLNPMDLECSHNLLRLTSTSSTTGLMPHPQQQHERFNGDWSFLDKLLASNQSQPHHHVDHVAATSSSTTTQLDNNSKFPFQYLGCDTDIFKFSNK